ncbi:hypothetical protein CALVIDRAFT_557783 [Calocera viscosa TUFC12733]|uniref:VOC domain-containing protein n=1 Tax=Calocera viscosa (strain TUFC12733) TaxID=1330018 RepID=A0A167HY20_CALVF|nr:hypothetical protein CALVIDRAFT_557783 [Calocera viscosa TUFC12733]
MTSAKVAIPFYRNVLGTLGWTAIFESPTIAGFGPGYLALIIHEKGKGHVPRAASDGTHVAFEAPSKQAVHDWYETALKAGAMDKGKPGPQTKISPNYYSAYVSDPDGYHLEAVYHLREEELK